MPTAANVPVGQDEPAPPEAIVNPVTHSFTVPLPQWVEDYCESTPRPPNHPSLLEKDES